MDAALDMLGRRRYSSPRLRARLLAKFPESDPEPVLERLRELGLLDDEAYARDAVRDRSGRRGQGVLKVKAALLAEGLGEALVSDALREAGGEAAERARGLEALRKYLRRHEGRGPEALRAAAYRHLRARGFEDELVCDLLRGSL